LEWLAFAALFVAIQFWQSRDMAAGSMPAISGDLADGRPASLAATLREAAGAPVLVYVWSAWCPICRAEEGTIAALAAERPVLTVAMQSGDAAAVAKLMAERGTHYPTLVDENGTIGWRLGVRGVPAWFVVDGKGRIRFSGSGYTSGWGLRLRLWWAAAAGA